MRRPSGKNCFTDELSVKRRRLVRHRLWSQKQCKRKGREGTFLARTRSEERRWCEDQEISCEENRFGQELDFSDESRAQFNRKSVVAAGDGSAHSPAAHQHAV